MTNKQDVLREISSLIKKQTASLQSRLSPEGAIRCQERSERIRKLFDQIKQHRLGEEIESSALAYSRDLR